MPAVTKNIYGKGHVYYVATQLEAAGLARVLDEATQKAAAFLYHSQPTKSRVVRTHLSVTDNPGF